MKVRFFQVLLTAAALAAWSCDALQTSAVEQHSSTPTNDAKVKHIQKQIDELVKKRDAEYKANSTIDAARKHEKQTKEALDIAIKERKEAEAAEAEAKKK